MSESGMQSRFLAWANARNDTMARAVSATSLGHHAGDPDTEGVTSGIPWRIELKQPGEKPTRIQEHQLREWSEVGCRVRWLTSLQAAKEFIKALAIEGDGVIDSTGVDF